MTYEERRFLHRSPGTPGARCVRLLGLIALAYASSAEAETPLEGGGEDGRAHLEYSAPAGCPDEGDLALRLQTRLGYEATRPRGENPRSMRVSITLEEASFVARLDERTNGEWVNLRDVRAASCDEVVGAIATVLAMSLDPFGEFAQLSRERERESLPPALVELDSEPPPPAADVAAEPDEPTRPAEETYRGLAVSARLTGLELPVLGIGASVSFIVERGPLALELGVAVISTPGYVVAGGSSLYNLVTGAEIAGYYSHGIFRAGPLLRGGAGFYAARGSELSIWRPAFQGGGRIGLRRRSVRVPWHVDIDFGANLLRSQVNVDGSEVWRSSAIFVQLRVGIELPLLGAL